MVMTALVYAPEALDDLQEILAFLGEQNPKLVAKFKPGRPHAGSAAFANKAGHRSLPWSVCRQRHFATA
jgi:hypothetical protein